MGEVDLSMLMVIYKYVTEFSNDNSIPYKFVVDQGKFETAIEFMSYSKHCHPPISSNWTAVKKNGYAIYCPDLLDYNNQIILEYEEEAKPQKGPKIRKKGHFEESAHDEARDTFYKEGGFRVFKIWQTDENWRFKLEQFIMYCRYDDINKTKPTTD